MRLHTGRLALRDFEKEDLDAVLAYRERANKKGPWLGLREENTEWPDDEGDEVSAGAAREEIRLAVLLKDENNLIGACRIRFTDTACLEAEILFDFDPQYLRKGYTTEAAVEVIRAGFEELQLQRISSWCVSSDASTARMLGRVGMRVDDVLPRSRWMRGEWWDTWVYSIQEAEWAAQRNEEPADLLPDKRDS